MRLFLSEFAIFIRKQASCALFGGLILFFLLLSRYVGIRGVPRYDALFVIAVLIQIILVWTKLEDPREVMVIIVFHISAMAMELYKISVGSWSYPEPAFFAIGAVPLFTGFMYSSVGSYIARSWRINKFRFENLPRRGILLLLGIVIYANFFTDHFTYDARWLIFFVLIAAFWKTKFYSTITTRIFQLHPLFTNALLASFIWLAEQIGTFARAWVYPYQKIGWQPVSFHTFTSWYMLLIFSFIIISLLYKREDKNVSIEA
ncbi:MAG TPA: DUF817 family protein [Candidatus Paceibacterota bacterium]|nr:DUF817 family protein [Candidatus Paceibacterota bacterium]